MKIERILAYLVLLAFCIAWFGMVLDIWMEGSFWIAMVADIAEPLPLAPRIVFSGFVSVFFLIIMWAIWGGYLKEAQ